MTEALSILYVDDEDDIAKIAKMSLEELGGHAVVW